MRWSWLPVLVCGCNLAFDVDQTILVDDPPDHDQDGIVSSDDNCPAIANPAQDDLDSDAVGDVCDPCVDGVQLYSDADLDGLDDGCDRCPRGAGEHDEDGDGVLDGCDNCPASANDQQANADSDDLGDACDPDAGVHHRRLVFAGFETLPAEWIPNSIEDWTVTDDAVGPVSPPAPAGPANGLWNRADAAAGTAWSIEAGAIIPAVPSSGYVVGVAMRQRWGVGNVQSACDLAYNQTQGVWYLTNGLSSMVVASPSGFTRLRMRQTAQRSVHCEYGATTMVRAYLAVELFTPTLYTGTNLAAFTFVDVVE